MSTERQLIAFPYYGGKQKHVNDILPFLPKTEAYCEPFCGSAAILLNRHQTPIEILNDLNKSITNFFMVLRDRKKSKELLRLLDLTPYSRAEFDEAWNETGESVEDARRFFIRSCMDIRRAGKRRDAGWSAVKSYKKNQFSYPPRNFNKKIDEKLPLVIERLKNVQIDNRPAIDVIQKFDSSQMLFYCDPPYLPSTRKSANDYKFDMSFKDHEELAGILNRCKAKVVLSGYDADQMDELYPGWWKRKFKLRRLPMSQKGRKNQECLWFNFNPDEMYGQQTLI